MHSPDKRAEGHLFLDELDARPRTVHGRRIVHRQQDPGDQLEYEREEKETAEGGLATTPTGCAIGQRLKDEANERRAERAAERERGALERKERVTS